MVASVAVAVFGCAANGLDRRMSDLEGEEARRQARLEELRAEISVAETRVAVARAEAEHHECKAGVAMRDAQIAVDKAECLRMVAERGACLAKNDSRTAKGTGLGCGAGWLAAIATGGAAAPAVLIGCAGGAAVSASTRRECGDVPRCSMVDDPMMEALRRSDGTTECPTPRVAVTASVASPPASLRRAASKCGAWRVARVEFEAPRRRRSGDAWDTDGSPPDLAYAISVDDAVSYRSEKYETFVWNHQPQAEVSVEPGQAVAIELVDRDLVSNDRIATFEVTLPAELPSSPLVVSSGRATVHVEIACARR